MKVETTTTHFVITATAKELKEYDELDWLMYMNQDSVWWARKGKGTPLMDPSDFVWYATGCRTLEGLEDQIRLQLSYPWVTLDLKLDRTLIERFEDGMTVEVGGDRYELRVQGKGWSEKALFDVGYLPTDTFVNCDQVYALRL